MPEGDTIYRTAVVLRRVLFGQVVTGFEIGHPKISAMARDEQIVGSTVTKVESNGKHLFIHFSTPKEAVLHTHMKMSGQWHAYRPGERWWEPESEARVVIRAENVVAVCFHPPICELLTAGELGLHPIVGALGPDIIRDEFDANEAIRRLRASEDRDIATALLDQKVISGIGNAFKVDALGSCAAIVMVARAARASGWIGARACGSWSAPGCRVMCAAPSWNRAGIPARTCASRGTARSART